MKITEWLLEKIGFKKRVIKYVFEEPDKNSDDTYEQHKKMESWSGRYV